MEDKLSILEETLLIIRTIVNKYHTQLDDNDLYKLLKLEREISRLV